MMVEFTQVTEQQKDMASMILEQGGVIREQQAQVGWEYLQTMSNGLRYLLLVK